MAEYSFTTLWKLNEPIQKVWDEIYDPASWPEWWDYVDSAKEIKKGDDHGIGSIWTYTWKTRLFYKFTFSVETTVVEPPYRLEGSARGDLEGTGIWTLSEKKDYTRVIYKWKVITTKPWMNYLAPVAYPLFNWNHDAVMDNGLEGLKKRFRKLRN